METIRKISAEEVEIVEEAKVVPETVLFTKTLEELESDLKQAQDSVAAQRAEFEARIAPQDETVAIMQKRVYEAKRQGVVVKVVEVVKDVVVEPILEVNPIIK